MPKLYFGSRGGVYYKKNRKKKYLTLTFGLFQEDCEKKHQRKIHVYDGEKKHEIKYCNNNPDGKYFPNPEIYDMFIKNLKVIKSNLITLTTKQLTQNEFDKIMKNLFKEYVYRYYIVSLDDNRYAYTDNDRIKHILLLLLITMTDDDFTDSIKNLGFFSSIRSEIRKIDVKQLKKYNYEFLNKRVKSENVKIHRKKGENPYYFEDSFDLEKSFIIKYAERIEGVYEKYLKKKEDKKSSIDMPKLFSTKQTAIQFMLNTIDELIQEREEDKRKIK